MNQFGRVLCKYLIFIAFSELLLFAYAKNFRIRYSTNKTEPSDVDSDSDTTASPSLTDTELSQYGTKALIKEVTEGNKLQFDLFDDDDPDTVQFSFIKGETNIEYMYGDIIVLFGVDSSRSNYSFRCNFENDVDAREFQVKFHPIPSNETKEDNIVELRLISDKPNVRNRTFPFQAGTVYSKWLSNLETTVFTIREDKSGTNDPRQAYLIFPSSGFFITEHYDKEVMIYPSTSESFRYILRFNDGKTASSFADKMVVFSENEELELLDNHYKFLQQFKP